MRTATIEDLTVRLQVDSNPVTVGQLLGSHFVVTNPTEHAVRFIGCPFTQFNFGLLPIDHADAALTSRSESSCGAARTSFPPKSRQSFFAAQYPTRGLAAGKYVFIVRFDGGGEARQTVTIRNGT